MNIEVKNCEECPFNYDTIQCVAADGKYGVNERTVRVADSDAEDFPNGCPLEDGNVIVSKADQTDL